MRPEILQLLIICPLAFTAGFVDSIAGGGGVISLPAYLLAGVPVHLAAGTNKFAMSLGTSVSVARFYKSGRVWIKPALLAALGALGGAYIGTRIALWLSDAALRISLTAVLPIVALVLIWAQRKKRSLPQDGQAAPFTARAVILSLIIGLGIGMYDGLFGPGTGTFLILAFSAFLGMDLVTASGSAKVVNLASNVASLATFLSQGKVLFAIGLPAAACTVLGNYLGSRLAVKNGERFVRPVIFGVLALLILKSVWDLLHG